MPTNKIGIIGFDQFQGKFDVGSSKIRVDWLINHWPEARRFKQGGDYETVIYQKAYFVDHAKAFKGKKILDMCDPDWIDGQKVIEMIQEVDAITCSSAALADEVKHFTDKPVYFIPDRVDLTVFPEMKEHETTARSVVWFGYAQNFETLTQTLKPITDMGLELIVVSNKPYHPPQSWLDKVDVTNYPWTEQSAYNDIMRGDMAINPKLSSYRFKYKSTNKTLIAWALGMPVANDDREMKHYLSAENRNIEARKRRAEVEIMWNVVKSVEEMKAVIDKIKK